MKALSLAALVCAVMLSGATARGAGFEGLRPDGPDAEKGQAGELAALDAENRTLRIGGNTFEAPAGLALDFDALHVGDRIVVHYRQNGSQLVLTRVEIAAEDGS